MLKLNIITLFPNLFSQHLDTLPFSRALNKKLVEINVIDLRDYSIDKHKTVDDKPYSGGTGMLLMIEPIYKALCDLHGVNFQEQIIKKEQNQIKIIVMAPSGNTYSQKKAQELSKYEEITFICGRYEGIDQRVLDNYATDIISIGDYVLSGGELPALVVMESTIRLLNGVLEKESALSEESFNDGEIEYPQYTRPENFMGLTVPQILLSGNHTEIVKWKNKNKRKKN